MLNTSTEPMKKAATIIIIFIIGCTAKFNQETTNLDDEQILVGKVNWDGLTQSPYGEWFTPNYLSYVVDSTTLAEVDINNIEIVMFLGTWCSDSQVEVPQFYKILDYIEYDLNKMTVVALERLENRDLVSPQHEEEEYNIGFVPTMIFLRDGIEIGRITEYPEKTLEKDMARIIMN
jgi:hypothetical protein